MRLLDRIVGPPLDALSRLYGVAESTAIPVLRLVNWVLFWVSAVAFSLVILALGATGVLVWTAMWFFTGRDLCGIAAGLRRCEEAQSHYSLAEADRVLPPPPKDPLLAEAELEVEAICRNEPPSTGGAAL